MTPMEQRYTIGRSTIGEYEAALREINNPISEDYIVNPDSTMSCDQLIAGINWCTARIQLWTTRLNSLTYKLFSGDKTTAENISKILNVLNTKLALYQQAHQIKCLNVQPVSELSPSEVLPEVTQTGSGSGSYILPLLLLAGGIWFISRKKRRGSRKRKR